MKVTRWYFLSKCSLFYVDLKNAIKHLRKCFSFFRKLRWNFLREFLSVMTRINVIGRERVKRRSYHLVRSEMLKRSFKTLKANHMYSCHNREKFLQQVPTILSPKQNTFLELFSHFWNLHKILRILKKKITFILSIFPELLIPKNIVTWMPGSPCFRTPFGS